MVSKGIFSLEDISAQEILATNNAKLINEKGISLIVFQDEKIKIKIQSKLERRVGMKGIDGSLQLMAILL